MGRETGRGFPLSVPGAVASTKAASGCRPGSGDRGRECAGFAGQDRDPQVSAHPPGPGGQAELLSPQQVPRKALLQGIPPSYLPNPAQAKPGSGEGWICPQRLADGPCSLSRGVKGLMVQAEGQIRFEPKKTKVWMPQGVAVFHCAV